MTIALRYAARSDVGLVRSNNQDSAYAGPHLLAVADGMGGHAGGDVASSVAVAHLAPLDDHPHGADEALEDLGEALATAHDELLARAEQNPELAGLGTTVTALLRSGNKLAMAHIGDSRAYLLREGELAQVTTDHSFVQHLVNTGKITAEEAENHPQRSVLLRVLGDFDMEIVPDMSVREARPGDRWLLCSDGLSGVVSAQTLATTMREIRDVDACADQLVQLALRGGAPDNVTVVVADVVEVDAAPDEPVAASHVVGAAALDRTASGGPANDGSADGAGHDRVGPGPGPGRGARGAAAAAPPDDPDADLADEQDDEDDEDDDDTLVDEPRARSTGRRVLWVLVVLVVLAAVVTAGVLGYRWTQDQYYVGVDDGRVAVFRGIPQSIGPLELSRPVETSTTEVDDLPAFVRMRVGETIRVTGLSEARDLVDDLGSEADGS